MIRPRMRSSWALVRGLLRMPIVVIVPAAMIGFSGILTLLYLDRLHSYCSYFNHPIAH